jgi:hypothetical protein
VTDHTRRGGATLVRATLARTLIGALALIAAAARPAAAQSNTAQPTNGAADRTVAPAPEKRIDVTPFVAMGDDLAPGAGGAVTFAWTRTVSLEAELSAGTDAARSSFSLLYSLPKLGQVTTYVAAGGGVQRYEMEAPTPGLGVVRRSLTRLAVNIGAGVSVPISGRWAYRADFRWYNPAAEWPESWRVFQGVSVALRH